MGLGSTALAAPQVVPSIASALRTNEFEGNELSSAQPPVETMSAGAPSAEMVVRPAWGARAGTASATPTATTTTAPAVVRCRRRRRSTPSATRAYKLGQSSVAALLVRRAAL